jgi:adenylate cyclase
MKPITDYEVYQVKFDRWALRQRLTGREQDRAVEIGRQMEVDSGQPVLVLEENLDQESGETTLRVIKRFGKPEPDVKGPPEDTDIGARIFMVGLNAVGIGAIAAVIAAIALAPLKDANPEPGAFNMLLMFIFAATLLGSGLALFKIYVPMELILWRAKDPETRRRTIEALVSGSARSEQAPRPVRPPLRAPPAAEPFQPAVSAAPPGTEQTSFQIAALTPEGQTPPDGAAAPPNGNAAALALPPDIAAAREIARNTLFIFTDAALGVLALSRPQLQAFERFGLNLYLAGAAVKACDLTEQTGITLGSDIRRELLGLTLERAGTNAVTVQSFAERLESSMIRPRYRALVDAGADAFTAPPGENGQPLHERLSDLLREWSDPTARGAKAESVIFLLTDIVGSTALTAKLGNSAAQKIVRAHNAIARAAVKDFRGREIKHTGDGMLLTFGDAPSAARAAMAIQQEAVSYAADNPEAPLSLRVGIHSGQAAAEEGEYHGEAVLLLDGICAAGEAGQIVCSEEIAARASGGALRFSDLGLKLLKGTEIERKVFKLEWTPKTKAPGPLEYRQIGGQT